MKLRSIVIGFFFVIITSVLLTSCKAIIEPSIANRQVSTLAPGDKIQATNYTVSFLWDDVEDALQYRLQIVSPKFDSVAILTLDTIVKSAKFTLSLSPGNYQWHVRAENGSSQTSYSAAKNFTIISSSLKSQKVQLNSPTNNFLTNQSNLNFSWGALYGATRYHLQIDTASFTDTTKLFYNKTIPGQQLIVAITRDQLYQWRVRAESDTAQSQWSAINYFNFDHTPPAAPLLTLPVDKQSVTTPVTLQWNNAVTAIKYKIYIYKSDGTTVYNSSFPATISTTSYSFTGVSGDTDYWKVTAIDAAGNESTASDLRSFTVQ